VVIAEHYLRRWRDAGLIDDGAVARIGAWEAQHRRPIWLWALSGMGALAIGLGVVAVVAANWEEIPAAAKLAVDLLLTGLCAVFVFVAWQRDQAGPREIGALLLFGLVIGGIALIGQVYQLQSDPWQALVTWLALYTPFPQWLPSHGWSARCGLRQQNDRHDDPQARRQIDKQMEDMALVQASKWSATIPYV